MLLFIDACARAESRTRALAEYLLAKLPKEETQVLPLYGAKLPVLDRETLRKRMADCAERNFSAPYYDFAKQFAAADTVVIAAPYWDFSFPAVLKQYLENICVSGLTFYYTEDNIPVGLCRAKKLYYVTTAGGPVFDRRLGFGYVKALTETMLGVGECVFFSAENLDLLGNDPDALMEDAKKELDRFFSAE